MEIFSGKQARPACDQKAEIKELHTNIGELMIETTVDERFAAVFPIEYLPCSAEATAMVRGPSQIFFADLDHSDDARIETGAKHWRYVPRFA